MLLQAGSRFRVKERVELSREEVAGRYGVHAIDARTTIVRMELIP